MSVRIELTKRQITLLRVALILRMGRIKEGKDNLDSYDECKALCELLWVMREHDKEGE